MHRHLLTRRVLPALVASISTLGLTAGAQASQVSTSNHAITIAAAPGETNVVVITTLASSGGQATSIQIDDSNPASQPADSPIAPIQHLVSPPTGNCTEPDPVNRPYRVVCTDSTGFTGITASLGDKDDYLAPSEGSIVPPITVDGGDGNDYLKGGNAGDTLKGGAGDDQLFGRGGNDLLAPGTGSDDVSGGDGRDTVDFSDHSAGQPVTVSLDDRPNDGGAGEQDNVHSDVEDITGGAGNDTLIGSALANTIVGGGGNDIISGGAGNDTISSGDGNDTIVGGEGADAIDAGAGSSDTVSYADKTDPVYANLGGAPSGTFCNDKASSDPSQPCEGDTITNAENLVGGSNDDHLVGNAAANVLAGGDGNDYVEGGDANDTLTGGAGNDTLDGGAGDDGLDGGAGDDTLIGGAGGDDIVGGSGTDFVSYRTASTGVNVSLDNVRNDGASCPGSSCENDNIHADIESIEGSNQNDVLVGSDGPNTLSGLGGSDRLDGGGGPDVLDGGDGIDTADYSSRTQAVIVTLDGVANDGPAAEGDNVLPSVENVIGGAGDDTLVGDAGANMLEGGPGNDMIDGGLGGDEMCGYRCSATSGDTGTDTVVYDRPAGETVLIALNGSSDSGTQSADAPEHDTIHSDIENVVGGAEDDVAEGSPAANVIDVGGGNNTVRAGAGDDVVRAGSGNDYLDGGAGNDLIQPGLGADQVIGGAGTADVVDYSERTNPVSVTFDDLANDGEAGEGDNVASDVELSRLPQLAGSTDQTLTSDQTQPQVDGSSSGSTTTVNPTTTPRATTRTVTIRGHVLVKPRAATAKSAAGCTGGGQVLVRLTRGSKVVGQRLVKVSRTCAFSAPVSVPRSTTGTLTVEVRYLGNRALKPTRRTTRLRLG